MVKRILGLTLCSCPMWSGGIGPFSIWQFNFCLPECVSSLLLGGIECLLLHSLSVHGDSLFFNDQLYFWIAFVLASPSEEACLTLWPCRLTDASILSSRCFSMKLAKLDAVFGDRNSFPFSGGGEVLYVCRDETFCTEEGG